MPLLSFAQSKDRYENWLKDELGPEFVATDLAEKNRLMRENAFVFLRGTYWRWAELVRELFPEEAARAPAVLAVGDIHLENFGTWRDVDGRLVWGVDDFDEAARMPYVHDLVRLAASAALAGDAGKTDPDMCDAILNGYRKGMQSRKPIGLDRDWGWLRDKVIVPDEIRQKFWKKIDARKAEPAPARFREAVEAAIPSPGLQFETARRVAGTGSLGRPRWIGVVEWQGAPIVREAKALLPSAWSLGEGSGATSILSGEIASGPYRSPDPWMQVANGIATRRLSPNNRKIEAATADFRLHTRRMLSTMGFELANIHAGTKAAVAAITSDLAARKSSWLATNAERAVKAILADYKQFKKS